MTLVNTPLRRLALAVGRGLPRRSRPADAAAARRRRCPLPPPDLGRVRPRPAARSPRSRGCRPPCAARRPPPLRASRWRASTCSACARPATSPSTSAPSCCCAACWRASRATPTRSSRSAASRSRATTSAAGCGSPAARRPGWPRCRSTVDALVELGRYGDARAGAAAAGGPEAEPLDLRAGVLPARAARRPRRRGERARPRRRGRRAGARERRRDRGAARRPRAGPRPAGGGARGVRPRAGEAPRYAPAEAGPARRLARRYATAGLPAPPIAPLSRPRRAAAAARVRHRRSARPSWRPGAVRAARQDLALVRRAAAAAARAPGSTRTRSSRCSRATTGGPRAGCGSRGGRGRRRRACAPPTRSAGR